MNKTTITTLLLFFVLCLNAQFSVLVNGEEETTGCTDAVHTAFLAEGLPFNEEQAMLNLRIEKNDYPHEIVLDSFVTGQDFVNFTLQKEGDYRIYIFVYRKIVAGPEGSDQQLGNVGYQFLGYNQVCGHITLNECTSQLPCDTVYIRDTIYMETVCEADAPNSCPQGISVYPNKVEWWDDIKFRVDNPFNEELTILVYNYHTGERITQIPMSSGDITTNAMQFGTGYFVAMIHGKYKDCKVYTVFQVYRN